jgi:hypothetical protein
MAAASDKRNSNAATPELLKRKKCSHPRTQMQPSISEPEI